MSLVKCSPEIGVHVKDWDVNDVATEATMDWLDDHLEKSICLSEVIKSII